jgi:hypothetical protein
LQYENIAFWLLQSGPKILTEEGLGVNYRALNDLFGIQEQRKDTICYEIAVQMMEIYNEQVRDLLQTGGNKKYPFTLSLILIMLLDILTFFFLHMLNIYLIYVGLLNAKKHWKFEIILKTELQFQMQMWCQSDRPLM